MKAQNKMTTPHSLFQNADDARTQEPVSGEASATTEPTKKVKFDNNNRKGKGRKGPPSGADARAATTTLKSLRTYPERKAVFQASTAVPALGDKTLVGKINVLGYRQTVLV